MRPLTMVAGVCALVLLVGGAVTGWRAYERHVDLPQPTCGSAVTHGLDSSTQLLSADPGALACFHAAARSCKAASIKVMDMGVDAGTDYVFVIKSGGHPCQVTEFSQFSIFTGEVHRNPVTITQCRATAVTARGVALSCSGQQILIPASV